MKLNYDCIRDILLTTEELDGLNSTIILKDYEKYSKLKKYSSDEIQYHSKKLHDANFIDAHCISYDGGYIMHQISDLTWSGHELLNSIRSDAVYNKTKKKILETVGSVSLAVFSELAKSISMKLLGL